jgi:hypothetical protein
MGATTRIVETTITITGMMMMGTFIYQEMINNEKTKGQEFNRIC